MGALDDVGPSSEPPATVVGAPQRAQPVPHPARRRPPVRQVFMALFFQGYDADIDPGSKWTYGIGRVPANGLPMRVTKLRAPAMQL